MLSCGVEVSVLVNSSGVRFPRLECGRTSLQSWRNRSMWNRASGMARKPVRRETLVTEAAVEALEVRVLHGFAWADEHELHAVAIRPEVERAGDQLRPVIHDDALREAADGREVSTSMRGHSRVNSSTIVRQRKRRPVMQLRCRRRG